MTESQAIAIIVDSTAPTACLSLRLSESSKQGALGAGGQLLAILYISNKKPLVTSKDSIKKIKMNCFSHQEAFHCTFPCPLQRC